MQDQDYSGWWWLSFRDPDANEFLGATVVEGADIEAAMTRAWEVGANPGGEIATIEIPQDKIELIPPKDRNRLLSRDEATSF